MSFSSLSLFSDIHIHIGLCFRVIPCVYLWISVCMHANTNTKPKTQFQWVADGSPTHSTAVRIENPLQFVPAGTNPKEFKKLQQLVSVNTNETTTKTPIC